MNSTTVTSRNHENASVPTADLDLAGHVRSGIHGLELLQKAAVGGVAELAFSNGRIRAHGDILVDASLRLQGSWKVRQEGRVTTNTHIGTMHFAGSPAVEAFLDVYGTRPLRVRLTVFEGWPDAWPTAMQRSLTHLLMATAMATDNATRAPSED